MKTSFFTAAAVCTLLGFGACKQEQATPNQPIYPDQEAISLVFKPEASQFKMNQRVSTETEAVSMQMTALMNSVQSLQFTPQAEGAEALVIMEKVRMEMRSPLEGMVDGGVYNSEYPDSATGNLQVMKEMFESLLHVPVKHQVSARGKVATVAENDSLSAKVQKALGNAYNSPSALWAMPLPEQPVKPGDAWEESQTIASEMGEIQTVTTYTLLRYTADSAFVQMSSTGHLPQPKGAFAQAKVKFQETGELVLHRTFGYVLTSNRHSEVEVILTMMGIDMTTRVKSNSAYWLEK